MVQTLICHKDAEGRWKMLLGLTGLLQLLKSVGVVNFDRCTVMDMAR